MKKILSIIITLVCIASLLVGCGQPASPTAGSSETVLTQTSDKLVAPDGTKYKYRLELTGRHPNAAKDGTIIVLTNNPNLTFEEVSHSLFSNSNDIITDIYIVKY